MSQTPIPTPFDKVPVPVVALGSAMNFGSNQGEMVGQVAGNVEAHVIADGGHFLPEECPDAVVEHVLALSLR